MGATLLFAKKAIPESPYITWWIQRVLLVGDTYFSVGTFSIKIRQFSPVKKEMTTFQIATHLSLFPFR